MLFSSHPAYLDPPNWQQLLDPQQQGHNNEFFQLPPLPPTSTHHVSGHGISIRSISMSDQARMSIVPQPDGPLKCPRCESTNTKFCYFNNYSLSQPRHFCKTCRRYWTRGGALRNVPVGGGYRKNKKSKNSSSKSTSSNARTIPSGCFSQQPQLPFMASLQNFTSFGIGNSELNRTNLKLSGFQGPLEDANYYSGQAKEHAFGGNNSLFAAAGFDAPTRFYSSIQSETVSAVEPLTKMDGNQELKLLRHFGESNQFYGGIHGQNYQV